MKTYLKISLLLLTFFCMNFSGYSQDARSQFPGKIFHQSDFVPGDSCATLNPERHDDFTHENGYTAVSDSARFVIKMRPASLPWTYTKVCVGWTKTGATTTQNYDIVVYDTLGSGGAPGGLIAVIPGQTISGIPQFPGMIWSSSVVSIPVTTSAVYIGVRYDGNPNLAIYVSMDESVATPLWPGYQGTGGPPIWVTIQSVFSGYRCAGIRTEGQPGGGVICNLFANGWCPINTYPVLPAATYFNASAWLGDTLYVQTPTTGGVGATTIYRYTWNGTWSTGVPCIVGVTGASLTACNGKLYLIGGGTASITAGTTNVQEYTPATGTWIARAPLPAALSAHGSVNWGDSVIFVVGGPYTGSGTNLAVHYYRPASNTWGTIAGSLPSGQGRRTFALGITNGNKIVMSCGFNTAYLKSTYVGTIGANATLITWAAGGDAPQSLSRPGGVGYNNTFFVVGGDTNGTAVKNTKVYCYNVSGNLWFNQILNNPNAVSNMMNAVTAKCISDTVRLFQPGGYTTVATNSFVVTGCNGTFTGIENISGLVPHNYNLSQNYPNPFNPKTLIEFSIPKSGNVKIAVFDILGREVSVLVNDFLTAGSYTVDFDASNFSSGVYFYSLRSGDFTATKKMMLVK